MQVTLNCEFHFNFLGQTDECGTRRRIATSAGWRPSDLRRFRSHCGRVPMQIAAISTPHSLVCHCVPIMWHPSSPPGGTWKNPLSPPGGTCVRNTRIGISVKCGTWFTQVPPGGLDGFFFPSQVPPVGLVWYTFKLTALKYSKWLVSCWLNVLLLIEALNFWWP